MDFWAKCGTGWWSGWNPMGTPKSYVMITRAPAELKTQNREKCRGWKNNIGVQCHSFITPYSSISKNILIFQLVQHCHALFYRGDIMRAVATNWFGKNLATRREGKGQSWDWALWITLIRKDFKRFWRKNKNKYTNLLLLKNIAKSTKSTGVSYFCREFV